MKKILVFIAVLTILVLSSCKTTEDCPKAYSQNIPVEAGK